MDSIQPTNNFLQPSQNPIDRDLEEVNDNLCGTRLHPWEYRKVFNIILAAMHGSLSEREFSFLKAIRDGRRISDIAITENLSVERVRQIILKAYLKIADVNNLDNIMNENISLKKENELLTKKIRNLEAGQSFVINMISRQEEKLNAIREKYGDKEHYENAIRCLNWKLIDTTLPARAINACFCANVYSVEDLVRSDKSTFLKFRNCGKRTINELSLFLEDMGFEWGMDIDELLALGPVAFGESYQEKKEA